MKVAFLNHPWADLPETTALYLGFGKKWRLVKNPGVNNKTCWGRSIQTQAPWLHQSGAA